ncbi:MAG TPA: histidinol-phosphatase HisJ family protein [Spirochaetota bacterium]|nr:histidinol-phosphatase HisJ family protein [Spirochaetota bacterium]
MIKYDLHTHSQFSPDAEDTVDLLCLTAIKKGITHLAITDHFDAHKDDTYPFYYNYEKQSIAIDNARVKYKDKLTLLKGIEYSQPYNTPEIFAQTIKLEFDIIIGSIHKIGHYNDYDKDNDTKYKKYFTNIKRMIEHGGFDVLGHIDFPARYYSGYYSHSRELEDAVKALCKSEVIPEINSSPLRRGMPFAMPDELILQMYTDFGGRYITTASDAHNANDIGADFDYIQKLIKRFNLLPVYFKDRKMFE